MRSFFKGFFIVVVNLAILAGLLGLMEFAVRRIEARRLGPKAAILPAAYMDRWQAWRNAPNWERIDIHHNSQGFRHDTDVPVEKSPGTVRIFLAGGSTAYGCEGLFRELDPQWTRIYNRDLIDVFLEKKLQEQHPERHWEVINAAANEYRMHQHLALFYTTLLRFKPDLIIFLDGHNDMSGIMSSTAPVYDPYAETPHDEEFEASVYPHSLRDLFFINSRWLRNNSALFSAFQRRFIVGKRFGAPPDSREPVHSPVQFEELNSAVQRQARADLAQCSYYTQMAERLYSALKHEGVESLFSLQPELILSAKPLTPVEAKFAQHMRQVSGPYVTYMYENMRPEISRQMTESAARNGYTYTDLENAFDNVHEKTFTDYCHLTRKGNELVAGKLYQAMSPTLIPKLVAGSQEALITSSR
jgi:lysophospholipase L1-like esterase